MVSRVDNLPKLFDLDRFGANEDPLLNRRSEVGHGAHCRKFH